MDYPKNHFRDKILTVLDHFYEPLNRIMPLHTYRYIVTGLANSGLDILLFYCFYNFLLRGHPLNLGLLTITPHIAAFMMAFSITFTTAYYINRYILFRETGLSKRQQFIRVFIVNITSVALTYTSLKLLVEYLHLLPTLSKIITTAFTSCVSYFTQTYFYFKKPED